MPGLLRRIAGAVHRLWVAALAVLLIAGAALQAPWKVLVLIAVFLLATAALPRVYRKWFWATIGLAVIIFVCWVLAPTDHEGWEQYKYDFSPQLAKLEQEREIPPPDNAALDYLALLEEDAADDANLTDQFCAVYSSPWKSSDYPDAAKSLEKHSQTIKKLMDISQIPECRFPLDNPSVYYLGATRYSAFGRWADLLAAAGNNDVGEGRIKQALEKYSAIAQIAQHQIQQGTRFDMMLGMGRKSLAYDLVRPLIMNGLDEEEISWVENTICAPDNHWKNAWSRMLEYDKLIAASEIMAYYEINQNGRIRLSRDPLWPMRIRMRKALNESYSDVNESSIWFKQLLKPMVYRMAYPSWSEAKLIKAGTFMRWLCLPASPDDAFAFNKKRSILSRARAQDRRYELMLQTHKRCMADRKGTLLMIALKCYKDAHGNWPENLAEVKPLASLDIFIDSLNNGEFVYKLTDEGFTLYSKGPNGIDEEGKLNKSCDDWMIWPKGIKKTKEGVDSDPEHDTDS